MSFKPSIIREQLVAKASIWFLFAQSFSTFRFLIGPYPTRIESHEA